MAILDETRVKMLKTTDLRDATGYQECVRSMKGSTVLPMRILLALMFFTPILAFALLQSGAERVTPYLLAIAVAATVLQFYLERRKTRA